MNILINIMSVLQSVLLVALIGSTDVDKTAKTDTIPPSVTAVATEIPVQSVKNDEKSPKLNDLIEEIEELNSKVGSLEKGVRKAKRRSGTLFVLLIAVSGGAFFFFRKGLDETQKRLSKQDKKIEQMQEELKGVVNKTTNDLMSQMKKIESETDNLKRQNREKANSNNSYTKEEPVTTQKITTREPSSKTESPAKVIKYFMLQESGGNLIVNNRHLKDDAIGWFCMEMNGEKAQYVINPRLVPQMLEDLSTLKMFTKDFDAIGNAKTIKTVAPGKMEKRGAEWVVTDRIKIKLE